MSARLVVDLSNKSAQLLDMAGHSLMAWSGVTRTTVLPKLHEFGLAPAGPWELTSPPDGFWCLVEPIEGMTDDG